MAMVPPHLWKKMIIRQMHLGIFFLNMYHKSLHMRVLVYIFNFFNHLSLVMPMVLCFYVPENNSRNVVFIPGTVWLPASRWSVYFSPFGYAAK
jgi:hypothetical protein